LWIIFLANKRETFNPTDLKTQQIILQKLVENEKLHEFIKQLIFRQLVQPLISFPRLFAHKFNF
jgi:hypothetical protein